MSDKEFPYRKRGVDANRNTWSGRGVQGRFAKMRWITIIRKKQFTAALVPVRYCIDGKIVATAKNGETVNFKIDTNPHELFMIAQMPKGTVKSNIVSIPADNEDKMFDLKAKMRFFKDAEFILSLFHSFPAKIVNVTMPDNFPTFKYHKNPLKTETFKHSGKICPACGQKKGYAYIHSLFGKDDEVECLCPWCIHDGSAAKKYKGEFISDYDKHININQYFIDELLHRTPLMETWQGIVWPAHCDDFCEFIDYVIWDDIKQMGIEKEIEKDLLENNKSFTVSEVKENLERDSSMTGYLFRCLKCGKHHLHIDLD